MFEEQLYISKLIIGHLRGQLDAQQKSELQAWLDTSVANRNFFEGFSDLGELRKDLDAYHRLDAGEIWRKTLIKIAQPGEPVPVKSLRPGRYLYRLAIAASVVLCMGIGIYYFVAKSYKAKVGMRSAAGDIKPGGHRAYLTLANGKVLELDTNRSSVVITDSLKNLAAAGLGMTSISTPVGGTYQAILPDGTQVWLNAASSIAFPSNFAGAKRRKIQLRGEAYFQVAKDKAHPFIVESKGQQVEVLGTHFNVNAYADEASIKTTLLEGSVKISSLDLSKSRMTVLKPNQQSEFTAAGIKVKLVDAEEAAGWKNGKFVFARETIQSIMRKVARWYDVEVVYEEIPVYNDFSGTMSRFESIDQILRKIEMTNEVHFKIEGRRVTVMK